MDGPPDIDDRRASLEQRLGLDAHDLAHALRAGSDGLVDMGAGRRRLRLSGRADVLGDIAAPQGVVEHHHARSAGHLAHQLGSLRMPKRQGLGFIPEVANGGGSLGNRDALHVQRQGAGEGARVLDPHAPRFVADVRLGPAVGPRIGVDEQLLGGGLGEHQFRLD